MIFRTRPIPVVVKAAKAAMLCLLLALPAYAPPPTWWSDSATRVLAPGKSPDNYAVANLGQLKHIAAMAKQHLDQHLATWGGAGPGVNAVVAGFLQNTPDNFAPANLGQLKAVAKPFYDRLRELGMNTNASLRANGYPAGWAHDYPWNPNDLWNQPTPPAQTVDKSTNLAPTNLGQLKLVFSFDMAKDTDGDELPDWWEIAHGLSATNPSDAGQTAAGGGMTNLQHFANGSNPNAAPPPATITAGTPQGDLDATQSIYPPGGVGSKLINGDFSQHTITDPDHPNWQRFYGTAGEPGWGFRPFGLEIGFGAIPGWSAIAGFTGTVVELQKSGTNQYCELDADWTLPRPTQPRPASDHGIQQMTFLSRGSYILAFDYKGRTWGTNQSNIAGDFVVTVQSGMTGPPVEVFRKAGAVADWKRAVNMITVDGGTATAPNVPVILKFDITDAADSYGTLIDNVVLIPMELKVTDFATKSDTVPYSATANAAPPKNSELCLKADKTTEKAKVEITLPSVTDSAMLAKMKWRVVQKPADTVIQEAVFSATPAAVELSLGSGSAVEDEILFEAQVGIDGGTFTPAAKMNVRVVRDRLNWWFEPFSVDANWRTAKPEPRADTGDYPDHKATAYKRESLESVYAFFKDNAPGIPPNFGSTAADTGQAKTRSWLKSEITCFSEFHDKLKTPNNNQLVDLNSITPLKLNSALDLEGAAGRPNLQKVLKHLIEKQTKVTVSSLPLLNYTNQKGTWAKNAATQLGDARLAYYDLLAFWQKEGSMNVRASPEQTSSFPAFGAPAPTTEDEAKVIFIAQVFWQNFGMDSLNPHLGAGADNRPDLANLASAVTHIQGQVNRLLGAGQGVAYFATLGATASTPGIYAVTSGEAFYTFTLKLLGRMILTDYWRSQGVVATYCSYNMGTAKFDQMVASLTSATYPERARLGLDDWGWHYEVRVGEWANPPADWPANKPGIRPNATRFWYFREIFKNLTTP